MARKVERLIRHLVLVLLDKEMMVDQGILLRLAAAEEQGQRDHRVLHQALVAMVE